MQPMRMRPGSRLARKILLAMLTLLAGGFWYLCLYEPRYGGSGAAGGRTLIFAPSGLGNYGPANNPHAAEQAHADGVDRAAADSQRTRAGESLNLPGPR